MFTSSQIKLNLVWEIRKSIDNIVRKSKQVHKCTTQIKPCLKKKLIKFVGNLNLAKTTKPAKIGACQDWRTACIFLLKYNAHSFNNSNFRIFYNNTDLPWMEAFQRTTICLDWRFPTGSPWDTPSVLQLAFLLNCNAHSLNTCNFRIFCLLLDRTTILGCQIFRNCNLKRSRCIVPTTCDFNN